MSTERDLYTRMSRATYQYAKDRAANAAEWTMLERAFRSGATDKFFSALTPKLNMTPTMQASCTGTIKAEQGRPDHDLLHRHLPRPRQLGPACLVVFLHHHLPG